MYPSIPCSQCIWMKCFQPPDWRHVCRNYFYELIFVLISLISALHLASRNTEHGSYYPLNWKETRTWKSTWTSEPNSRNRTVTKMKHTHKLSHKHTHIHKYTVNVFSNASVSMKLSNTHNSINTKSYTYFTEIPFKALYTEHIRSFKHEHNRSTSILSK